MSTWFGVMSMAACGTGNTSTTSAPTNSKLRGQNPPVSISKVIGNVPAEVY